ncbi:putative hydroxyethylthiazole kinase [Coprococcus comes ATCC 27758]|uniref:Hydroxyethylthiazole kinase n=2 Tax=Coprococcus comes TaxID=410072 RepID=C0BAH9_9FIRM|nr:putative hydroxyethylthiazole kinase [Coprococcus comes ATCC 27758]
MKRRKADIYLSFYNYRDNFKDIRNNMIYRRKRMLGNYLDEVRKKAPLIHNITNYVTINDVANMVLACGASPIMSDEPTDIEEITSICQGLNINMGMLNPRKIESMQKAGKKSNELHHKVLLDPVGAGSSSFRTEAALNLIRDIQFDVIRGNISEIKTLAAGHGTTSGVDADEADTLTEQNLEKMIPFIKDFSRRTGSVIAVTGGIDLVSDAKRCFVIRNGRPEMGRITGTGCQLSGMMTAFLAANPENNLEAAAAAVCAMGLAGETGWKYMQPGDGNATYRNRIIDAIYNMEGKELEEGAKYEIR